MTTLRIRCLSCTKLHQRRKPWESGSKGWGEVDSEWAVWGVSSCEGEIRLADNVRRAENFTIPHKDWILSSQACRRVMPQGCGICDECFDNPPSKIHYLLECVKGLEGRKFSICSMREEKIVLEGKTSLELEEIAAENMKKIKEQEEKGEPWPITLAGWKAFSRALCFIIDTVDHAITTGVKGREISWKSTTTGSYVNGRIEEFDKMNMKYKISRVRNGKIYRKWVNIYMVFPKDFIKMCNLHCYCLTCSHPKCCVYCNKPTLEGERGPGGYTYCSKCPVESHFVIGTANRYEIFAWIESQTAKNEGYPMVIDPESALGIGVWGFPEKTEVIAECEGCRITRKVKDLNVKIKENECHECGKLTCYGSIQLKTGDTNWYCDCCWGKYWERDSQLHMKYEKDFPKMN